MGTLSRITHSCLIQYIKKYYYEIFIQTPKNVYVLSANIDTSRNPSHRNTLNYKEEKFAQYLSQNYSYKILEEYNVQYQPNVKCIMKHLQ